MRKTSSLRDIKDMALSFLHLPVEETEVSPIVVQHPIFDSGFQAVKDGEEIKIVNIIEDSAGLQHTINTISHVIDIADNVRAVYMVIRQSYRLTFIKYIKPYLSMLDFSELLADAWVCSENPNQDANVSIALATKWFKQADKQMLMTEEDYQIYADLPDKFKVYRGVAVGGNPQGLSWTQDKNKASWFAHRFDKEDSKGYVQYGTAMKEDVLAYFNTRDENEIVINIKSLSDVGVI